MASTCSLILSRMRFIIVFALITQLVVSTSETPLQTVSTINSTTTPLPPALSVVNVPKICRVGFALDNRGNCRRIISG